MLATAMDPKNFPLALRAIYVRGSSTTMKESFDPFIANQHLAARFRSQKPTVVVRPAGDDGVEGVCTFLNRFDFRYSLAAPGVVVDDDSAMVAEVQATLAVDYVVRGDLPSALELDAWGQTSAVIHCWPYWREFCHTAISRMNLPIVLMPMIDVQAILQRNPLTESAGPAEPTRPKAAKKKTVSKKSK